MKEQIRIPNKELPVKWYERFDEDCGTYYVSRPVWFLDLNLEWVYGRFRADYDQKEAIADSTINGFCFAWMYGAKNDKPTKRHTDDALFLLHKFLLKDGFYNPPSDGSACQG